ncbi:O-antigen ligase [Erythrobacter sp. JK5]|uniref:O-antigen ligase family protein n=1 Tax=Erythrobacter sp. JK5 TaxID=2829500 RepID=UPI001BAB4E24|nr:hypothetical protein [Erythrobacter sp. JK5]QUL37671.1 hypothetical protein KDC96_15200 [Erythrobacter sp. JK5]
MSTLPLSNPATIRYRPQPRYGKLPLYFAVLLGYILLLPPQLNQTVMGATLPPYRLFLIPATLFVIASAINGRFRFTWPDLLVLIAGTWIGVALFVTTDQAEALPAAVAQVTDTALAYFFARSVFRSLRDLRLFLLLLLPGLLAVGAIIAVESITHNHILQPFISQFTGQSAYLRTDIRLGFMRARGPFPHPILAGVFLASFLPLFLLSGLRSWPFVLGIAAALTSFFTVSSAALLGLSVGTMLTVYNWLSERFLNLSWRLLFILGAIVVFLLEFGTRGGAFSTIMRFGSLNSYSGYNRVLIWRFGTENVAANPWFGLGYGEWERPEWMKGSVDNFWLLQAMQFGVIPPLLIAIACLVTVYTLARRSSHSHPVDGRFERGVAIALAVFAFGIVSVAIWLSAQAWFYMLLGIAVSLAFAERSAVRRPGAVPLRPPPDAFARGDDGVRARPPAGQVQPDPR